jgi:5-methylcytosine-specific restriction endonuclease McrA
MAQAPRVGYLEPDVDDLAQLVGERRETIADLLDELLSSHAFKRNRRGRVYFEPLITLVPAPPSAVMRAAIFARDGLICRYCSETTGPFEIDHIRPRARGGLSTENNLTVACARCNRSKSDLTLNEWLGSNG